jgi:hypothetical protein
MKNAAQSYRIGIILSNTIFHNSAKYILTYLKEKLTILNIITIEISQQA